MAPFWGPILSVWSSYSRNPDIMTTDKTTTVWLCLGVNTGSSRLNGLKTHMEMAWIPKRGVPWLKSHSDRPIHRPFCHILTIPSPPTDQHQPGRHKQLKIHSRINEKRAAKVPPTTTTGPAWSQDGGRASLPHCSCWSTGTCKNGAYSPAWPPDAHQNSPGG